MNTQQQKQPRRNLVEEWLDKTTESWRWIHAAANNAKVPPSRGLLKR